MPDLDALLRELKERSGLSYEALAGRCGASASAVHRYCRGRVVPGSYGMVERIGTACGASRQELHALYEAWRSASAVTAVRERPVRERMVDGGPGGEGPGGEGPVGGPRPPEAAPARGAPVPPSARPAGARHRPLATAVAMVCLVALLAAGSTARGTARGPREARHAPKAAQWVPGPAWSQPPAPVPPAFFGVTLNSSSGAMPGFTVGAVRLWDSRTRWSLLEPARGHFSWTVLDRLVAGARRAGLPVLLSFGGTPGWASPGGPRTPYGDGSRTSPPDRPADWTDFVHAVAARYRGRIQAYELWSLAPSPHYWTGGAEELARMARGAAAVLRRDDPAATVVCPSMAGLREPSAQEFLLRFAAAGGYQDCDAAGVKLTQRSPAGPPEDFVRLQEIIERTFHRAGVHPPLWNTGTAYEIAETAPLSEREAVDHAVRFYLVGLYLRYRRSYFYDWGGTRLPVVLQAEGGPPTAAGRAVGALQGWLRGARIGSCGSGRADGLPAHVWQCRFLLPPDASGRPVPAVIRWADRGSAPVPTGAGARAVRHLDGRTGPAGRTVTVTGEPLMITYRPGRA
ncbi:helix-turn-helix domain-containing protein [Streptomyces sp. NPDC058319]|uniref:helix-turn-helix domain-containing protein n=1 Tax=unclassified Streptomyces TaxID=2593676 RepID=UPI0036EC3F26